MEGACERLPKEGMRRPDLADEKASEGGKEGREVRGSSDPAQQVKGCRQA